MQQDQNFDLTGWWNEQSFTGKELFQLSETGEIILIGGSNTKERIIATVSAENADVVIKTLLEKFGNISARVKELEIEWLAATDKLKLTDKVAEIKQLLENGNALGDFRQLGMLVRDWQHTIFTLTEENYALKGKLAELAEELAGSSEWKETTVAFRELAEKWKQYGYVDKNRNDKLWNRIEAARKAFMDRKRQNQEDEEKDMLHNLDLKIDLVEQAETIAASDDWKKTTDTFHRLTEEWKTIGHTINKKNEELWQRFQAAKSVFFEKKREHSTKIQLEHEQNYIVKVALADRAETLKDSTDWTITTQAFAALMEEWKKAGRVQHDKGDELWKRYNDAQDKFFEAKKLHFDAQRSVLDENYNRKKVIYDRAETVKHSTHWSDATAEMLELLEEWKTIGPVHRSHGDKMWEDFNAARKFFFARKDASREQRKQLVETQKVVRAQQAKDVIVNLAVEIKEEEEKLVDFKIAIENITPGKKAGELRTHLEQLIADGTHKIKRLQEKHAQAQKDIAAAEIADKDNAPAVV
jgi:hypothetical protein